MKDAAQLVSKVLVLDADRASRATIRQNLALSEKLLTAETPTALRRIPAASAVDSPQ